MHHKPINPTRRDAGERSENRGQGKPKRKRHMEDQLMVDNRMRAEKQYENEIEEKGKDQGEAEHVRGQRQ